MNRHPRIINFLLAVVCIGLLLLLGFFLVLNHRNQASETDRLKALARGSRAGGTDRYRPGRNFPGSGRSGKYRS